MNEKATVLNDRESTEDINASGRNDFERLEEPPYEKDLFQLGMTSVENSDDREQIRVYRYTERSTGMELQIRSAYQIIFALQGECTLDIQGKKSVLSENGLLLVARGIPHLIHVPESSRIIGTVLPVSVLKRSFNKIVEYQSPVSSFVSNSLWGDVTSPFMLFHKPAGKYVRSLIDMLMSEELYPSVNSPLIKNFIVMALIGFLSSYLPTEYDLSSMRMIRSDQMPKILNFINDNYRTVTLESLAKHFHYTVPYVSKLIRTTTGMTFTAILRETRFDVCRWMLVNSDLKIYQVAEIAGFQNTDHFNRSFKKRTGITPSEYKKQKLDNALDNVQ